MLDISILASRRRTPPPPSSFVRPQYLPGIIHETYIGRAYKCGEQGEMGIRPPVGPVATIACLAVCPPDSEGPASGPLLLPRLAMPRLRPKPQPWSPLSLPRRLCASLRLLPGWGLGTARTRCGPPRAYSKLVSREGILEPGVTAGSGKPARHAPRASRTLGMLGLGCHPLPEGGEDAVRDVGQRFADVQAGPRPCGEAYIGFAYVGLLLFAVSFCS